MNFFGTNLREKGKKNAPRTKSAVHSKVLQILNKIRVNSNRIPLRQEEDNLSVRVKAERRNKNAAGLTPRDYPVRWVHFSRLMFQPVSSLTSNPRAQRSAATGDVKTLLGNELSPRQEDIRHAATAK